MSYVKVSRGSDKGFKNGYLFTTISGVLQTAVIFFKQIFGFEKTVTVQWPEEKYQYSDRFKGKHYLTKRPDGRVRCTACFLCATNCPAECIKITASENPDPKVEKYPISYEIDILRCIFCGFCEEACPVDAIRLGPEWQTPGVNGGNFIYDINRLAYRSSLKGGIQSHVDDEERHKEGI